MQVVKGLVNETVGGSPELSESSVKTFHRVYHCFF